MILPSPNEKKFNDKYRTIIIICAIANMSTNKNFFNSDSRYIHSRHFEIQIFFVEKPCLTDQIIFIP